MADLEITPTSVNLTGEVTSVGNAASLDVTAISNQSLVTAVTGDMVLIEDATDGLLKRVNASDFLSGSGDVTKVGTPVNDEIGVWTGDGTIEGDPNFTWDGSLLDINQFGTALSFITPTLNIADNFAGIAGVEMYNADSGITGDFRFVVADDAKDQYLAFSMPSTGNTATLFGQTRSAITTIFANSVGAGTDRKLAIGTVHSTDFILGTNNTERMVIGATGTVTLSTTLAMGSNDITATGSLGATGARLTKGWFTDLEVTNAIAGSITGNAATVTTNANLTGEITSSGNAASLDVTAISNQSLVTAVGADTLLIIDATDGQLKKALASDIIGGGGGLTWNEVTGTTQSAAVNNGYITNNASLVTVTIPDTAAVGDVVRVAGSGAGGWLIAQNAGESINFGSQVTTTGAGGSLASTNRYDAVELICITANTTWTVLSSVGNITIV